MRKHEEVYEQGKQGVFRPCHAPTQKGDIMNYLCDECSNKLETHYDPILEETYVKVCMNCVNKYIVEAKVGVDIVSIKAQLTALNEIYRILLKGDKK